MSSINPELPCFYLSLTQVRESGLLTETRMQQIDEEIEKRLTKPRDAWGKVIESARLADLSPYGEWLYPRMTHEGDNWDFAKKQILCAILTEEERKLLDRDAFTASCAARERERFAKAKHVPEAEWDGGVFHGDDYYPSVDDFKTIWEMDHDYSPEGIVPVDDKDRWMEPYPEYVWAAKKLVVINHLDVGDMLEGQASDRGWDDLDCTIDLHGFAELQAACDAFVRVNADVVSYREDNTIAIILESRKP